MTSTCMHLSVFKFIVWRKKDNPGKLCPPPLPAVHTKTHIKENNWCANIYSLILINVALFVWINIDVINLCLFYNHYQLAWDSICVHFSQRWCAVLAIFLVCMCSKLYVHVSGTYETECQNYPISLKANTSFWYIKKQSLQSYNLSWKFNNSLKL